MDIAEMLNAKREPEVEIYVQSSEDEGPMVPNHLRVRIMGFNWPLGPWGRWSPIPDHTPDGQQGKALWIRTPV